MPDAVDADARDGDAFERAQQNTAERVAKRRAITGLERFDAISAVVQAGFNGIDSEMRFFEQPGIASSMRGTCTRMIERSLRLGETRSGNALPAVVLDDQRFVERRDLDLIAGRADSCTFPLRSPMLTLEPIRRSLRLQAPRRSP